MRQDSGAGRRPGFKAAVIAAVALTAVAIGANVVAQQSDDDSGSEAPPGHPVSREPAEVSGELITTGGGTFDPTVLTKFIPGTGFDPMQGYDAFADLVADPGENSTCVSAGDMSGGSVIEFRASVELPDGSQIKQIIFYGQDDALGNISIRLTKTTVNVPSLIGSDPTRSDAEVTSFTTLGETGVIVLASDDDLEEIVGSKSGGGIVGGIDHQFHQIRVVLNNSGVSDHVMCGVEVQYQVPTKAEGDGATFFPIDPVRAWDGRIASYPNSGLLAPNTSKVISVKDGHDAAGVVNLADAVPSGATAVTYNATVAGPTGPNFISVTPGDATGFTTSALNFNGTSDVANAGTVTLDTSRQVKLWGGNQAGSMFVIIDITGYYAPAVHPNMGN